MIVLLCYIFYMTSPILFFLGIPILYKYIKYSRSEYKVESGNGFAKTVFEKGNYGEFLTFSYLEKLPRFKKLLVNLYIPKKDGTTTEIDLVMVDETGIYVFESKNYSGWIFGNEKNKTWTQTLGNKTKNKFFNPIWQNKAHIKALANVLPEFEESIYKSYIVFSERCTLRKIDIYSPEVKVIKREDLLYTIKKDILESKNVLSKTKVIETYNILSKFTIVDEDVKRKHIENVKSYQN